MTKGMAAMLVYTTKECNYNSIVIVHQHGGHDVTYKPRIIKMVHKKNVSRLGGSYIQNARSVLCPGMELMLVKVFVPKLFRIY